ncbi:MAG: sigma-54-dependent Fis family transcriptional regulator [Deltaproteobacteria bacterium]|nr:MAG: sigma-54-dependent Fis family transcriptional regulator [Deltaproteobacteria bacterium]
MPAAGRKGGIGVMDGHPDWPQLHILVVEDDPRHAASMRQALMRMEPGVRVTTVDRLQRALDALQDPAIGCVVTDLRLPDAEDARIVRALRAARRDVPIIVAAGTGSEELAVAAMKLGAADYVTKHPRFVEQLPILVRDALGRSVLAGIDPAGGEAAPGVAGGGIDETSPIATTAGMRAVLALVDRAARSAVLVQNCAAISESLLESELFGHLRGAFTGADRDRKGLFEEAGDGTVFLDEVGEAPPSVQAKLLRVLQHEEVKAVGADKVRRVRARIVAATNRPLETEARAGRFRIDLYYRLAVLPLRVPPLRHRAADVPALIDHFLRRFEAREGRETGGFDGDAVRTLQAYPWPGNVRELENEMHRLVLCVAQGQRIRRQHLARRIRDADPAAHDEPLARLLERVEIALIRQRLQEKPTKTAAARSLGITREALYAKMRRLGMTTRDERLPPESAAGPRRGASYERRA